MTQPIKMSAQEFIEVMDSLPNPNGIGFLRGTRSEDYRVCYIPKSLSSQYNQFIEKCSGTPKVESTLASIHTIQFRLNRDFYRARWEPVQPILITNNPD